MKPFSYTIHSRDRSSGTIDLYQINQFREVLGDWKVTVRVAPFITANALGVDPNGILELSVRGANIAHASSDASNGWCSVLSILPGAFGGEGIFFVSGGFRGPFDVKWEDTGAANLSADTTDFPEHSINLVFEPI
jgi:hypothetical protein